MTDGRLTDDRLAAARAALLGDDGDGLMRLVHGLSIRQPTPPDARAHSLGTELGWISGPADAPELSGDGHLVQDPIREYVFWLERERRLHSEREHPDLRPQMYEGKAVLEPGSGFGCNLLSLLAAGVTGRFVGLEPVPLYLQFTSIFAEREKLAVPEVVLGGCEAIPFANETFDVVLCYSAHQYMELDVAICEMARVLRPGGELRLVGHTLPPFALASAKRALGERNLGTMKYDGMTLLNTAAYQLLGRRVFVPSAASRTAAPIYPTRGVLTERLDDVGLEVDDARSRRLGEETVLFATKVRG